jgi:hypothetical protein
MAGPKKPEHAPASDAGIWIIGGLVVLATVVFGFTALFDPHYLNLEYVFGKIANGVGPIIDSITNPYTWHVVGIVSSIISIFLIAVIIFSLVRMREIQNHEKEEIAHEISLAMARDAEEAAKVNPRWKYILGLIGSDSPNDWRIAILEADSMLDEVLQERGYEGDSLGERLKGARDNSFASLDNAWEAHNIRNGIAHSGSDFSLTQIEARRTIRLYETVFDEFGAI